MSEEIVCKTCGKEKGEEKGWACFFGMDGATWRCTECKDDPETFPRLPLFDFRPENNPAIAYGKKNEGKAQLTRKKIDQLRGTTPPEFLGASIVKCEPEEFEVVNGIKFCKVDEKRPFSIPVDPIYNGRHFIPQIIMPGETWDYYRFTKAQIEALEKE